MAHEEMACSASHSHAGIRLRTLHLRWKRHFLLEKKRFKGSVGSRIGYNYSRFYSGLLHTRSLSLSPFYFRTCSLAKQWKMYFFEIKFLNHQLKKQKKKRFTSLFVPHQTSGRAYQMGWMGASFLACVRNVCPLKGTCDAVFRVSVCLRLP